MENKLFACEMSGCFDSAEYDITFSDEPDTTYQVCQSCLDYWQFEESTSVTVKERVNGSA